ncbi:hypothetical protein QQF64_018351 [Cirrhinus molitorella]|uniref:Uncharacterized protein n=1 Tax=Cirrhinus molitorella TaxID=172907 RepID=A0ABR3LDV5_9TELE
MQKLQNILTSADVQDPNNNPSTSTSWCLRQSVAQDEWQKARSYHINCLLSCNVVPERSCSYCSSPAIIHCRDCMPQEWLCMDCDIHIHKKLTLHNRESCIEGIYKPIEPAVCCVKKDGRYTLAGKIHGDVFQRSYMEYTFCQYQCEKMASVEHFTCPACKPSMLALCADGNRKLYRFRQSKGSEKPYFDGTFIAKDTDVHHFVDEIRSKMKSIIWSGKNQEGAGTTAGEVVELVNSYLSRYALTTKLETFEIICVFIHIHSFISFQIKWINQTSWCCIQQKVYTSPVEGTCAMKLEALNDQLQESIKKLNSDFDKKHSTLISKIKDLNDITNELESIHKATTVGSLVGSSVGAAGGIAALVGLALSFFTFGASLAITGVGVAVGIAGGVTGAACNITNMINQNNMRHTIENIIKDFQNTINPVIQHLSQVSKITEVLQQAKQTYSVQNKEKQKKSSQKL